MALALDLVGHTIVNPSILIDIDINFSGTIAAPVAKIFVGITAWFDILGAVTLHQQPMLGLQLLAQILADDSEIQLRSIMGCENRVRCLLLMHWASDDCLTLATHPFF